jgi:glycosyltransferase involved in cell wall biosynthesis
MPLVNITIPVLNEQARLPDGVARLERFLQAQTGAEFEVVIADNGSEDRTPALADSLAQSYPALRVLHLPLRGRGRALKTAWQQSRADILGYMDVDLSTDLAALPPLLGALVSGRFDLAVGSRLDAKSQITRSCRREIISRWSALGLSSPTRSAGSRRSPAPPLTGCCP